ncbi:MAG: hypothetical protein JRE58_10440 [Deltaproteobacteria bacterium]|nr:hypothetical protein [Deltaproteobacteria bacterium]
MRDGELGTYILKHGGLVAATVSGEYSGECVVCDFGAGALMEGTMFIDISAIEIADNDELYKISLQGSSKSNFSDTYEDLAILEVGANEVLGGDQDSETGRYKVPFRNERNGTIYRYGRVYTTVSGTVGTGVNFTCWLGI